MNIFILLTWILWLRCTLGLNVGQLIPESEEIAKVEDIEDKSTPNKREASFPMKTEPSPQVGRSASMWTPLNSDTAIDTTSGKKGKKGKGKRRVRKITKWDKSKQVGWVELKPAFGKLMYAQPHATSNIFCLLGYTGPECDSADYDDNSEDNDNGRYDGNGYKTDCHTEELNRLRDAVEAAVVTETTKKVVEEMNMFISRAFIARAMGKYNNTVDQEPKNGFTLFDTMMSLVHNICPPSTMPQTFLDSLSFFTKELHAFVSPSRTPYIEDDEFTWINRILTKCHNRTRFDFRAPTDMICRAELTPLLPNGTYLCNGPPLNVEFHFHEKVYDPALDVIWHILTAIQYLCFDDFNIESIRMFHHFASAIMDLFSAPMKVKWTNQIESDYKTKFARLLGPFYRVYQENMERCVLYIKDKVKMNYITLPRFYSYGSIRYNNK